MTPPDPSYAALSLLTQLGKPAHSSLIALAGGRNNRVWRVDCGSESFLLKNYFWSEADPRDRLGQEWAFLDFLQSIGSRKAPAPLAKDPSTRFALLEFIPGNPPQEIGESDILDAAEFFAEMNAQSAFDKNLPPVSEACFSIQAHLETTAARIDRLQQIQSTSEEHEQAVLFIRDTLLPLWHDLRKKIEDIPDSTRREILPPSERCLSPSDFGFHNALRQSDGTLRYVDFEYAGWDDPAKTLIDFTNQPDRLLSENLAALFLEKTIPLFPNPDALHQRLALLTPLYQIKWACICLNAFFPGRPTDPHRSLSLQLSRARVSAIRAEGRVSEE
jgi:Phosphotransferase enzyme family